MSKENLIDMSSNRAQIDTLSGEMKKTAADAIENAAEDLRAVSDTIWQNPETAFREHIAHDTLTDFLQKNGFQVERGYHMETAFRAEYGHNCGPNVAILCEYDALPDIGHACGHNLIAEVGVATSIGIKAALEHAKKELGKVTVLGTPGEEGGGGKIMLLKAGALKEVDVAMMAHPGIHDTVETNIFIATVRLQITFKGKASHAAGSPWKGINALDAAVLMYNSVSCLRQQMKPEWLVHGIITNGGSRPNVIPEVTEMVYQARAPTQPELNLLETKLKTCAEAAATATGCQVEITYPSHGYYDVRINPTLASLYKSNAATFGMEPDNMECSENIKASTDMGNVSYVVPSIHPMFHIGTSAAHHTRDYAHAVGKAEAQPHTLKQAKVLAMTGIDVFIQPHLVDKMVQELQKTTLM